MVDEVGSESEYMSHESYALSVTTAAIAFEQTQPSVLSLLTLTRYPGCFSGK